VLHKNNLVTITAILSVLTGLAYLLFPGLSASFFGAISDGYSLHITRYYGACALGYGALLWLVRKSDSTKESQAVLISILILLGISVVVGIMGLINGVTNQFGLLIVITDLTLSLWSFLLLSTRSKSE
jgi:hypothetical protein